MSEYVEPSDADIYRCPDDVQEYIENLRFDVRLLDTLIAKAARLDEVIERCRVELANQSAMTAYANGYKDMAEEILQIAKGGE